MDIASVAKGEKGKKNIVRDLLHFIVLPIHNSYKKMEVQRKKIEKNIIFILSIYIFYFMLFSSPIKINDCT